MSCQQCSPAAEADDDAEFVAWRDAAIECLPEHNGTVAEVLSLIGCFPPANVARARRLANDEAHKARRVSKQKADEVVGSACMSWDNPFYVLAVGRGSPSGLRPDALAGLLALLVGHKPTNEHLTKAALLSLARIFAGSKDQLISNRILTVWENHENSDVRADALLAIFVLANIDVMRYAFTIRDSGAASEAASLWHVCQDPRVQPDAKLDWAVLKEILTDDFASHRVVVFVLLRLRIATDKEIEAVVSASELCNVLVKHVFGKSLCPRLVIQTAFGFIDAHIELLAKLRPADKDNLLGSVADLAEGCAFYEVRRAATAALKSLGDERAEIGVLLSVPARIDKQALKSKFLAKYPGLRPTEAADSGVVGVFNGKYEGKFASYLKACRILKGDVYKQAPDSKEYPGIVAMYYLLLEITDVAGEALSELLASRRFIERQMALVHVGLSQRVAFRNQVVHLQANDPIKDVRLCAAKVLDLWAGPKEVVDPIQRTLELYTELLDRERLNLVLDLEFITRVQEESEALDLLKNFNESGSGMEVDADS